MKLNELVNQSHDPVQEGFWHETGDAVKVLGKGVLGAVMADAAFIGLDAANIMADNKLGMHIPFWSALRMALIGTTTALTGGALSGGIGALVVVGAAGALMKILPEFGSGKVRRNIKKLNDMVEDRDALIKQVATSGDGDSMQKIMDMSRKIDRLARKTRTMIDNDKGLPGLLALGGDELSEDELDAINAFMGAQYNRAHKGEIMLSNLDKRTIDKFNDMVEKKVNEADTPED